jgi:hypothetical protein
MAEIILHPTHPDYCKECIYDNIKTGACTNEKYIENSYKVNCVWGYCKYKKKHKQEVKANENHCNY